MRIDALSIFPEYFHALNLSLPGKAQEKGLLEFFAHDLRKFANDKHRTVDDTPYGGGAGMVMKAQPWWEALESVHTDTPATLVIPSPSGVQFTQKHAADLSAEKHLIFACGRYEGIDERFIAAAQAKMPVQILSLGDYVLNGGEVAALAMIEAIVRLIPGFMGNADSLLEESHTGGLLEYPVYTKPSSWRGAEVPPVLLSGNHQKIATWRLEQRRQRTAAIRPDLLSQDSLAALTAQNGIANGLGGPDIRLEIAQPADLPEILTLTRAAWAPELLHAPSPTVRALIQEDLEDLSAAQETWDIWGLFSGQRLIGSVRTRAASIGPHPGWEIARIMVAPDLQRNGWGKVLLQFALQQCLHEHRPYLCVGNSNEVAQRIYKKAGFYAVPAQVASPPAGGILLWKKS